MRKVLLIRYNVVLLSFYGLYCHFCLRCTVLSAVHRYYFLYYKFVQSYEQVDELCILINISALFTFGYNTNYITEIQTHVF
jgi:hypothetical protein